MYSIVEAVVFVGGLGSSIFYMVYVQLRSTAAAAAATVVWPPLLLII